MSSRPATDYRIQHLREKLGELYDFQALLGRGAFAAVYLVRNLRLDRLEAFKVLSDTYDHDQAFVRRFIQEAKLVASLDHPNIVKVYDYGEVDGIVWFSMQYVDGPTLRAEISVQGRLEPIAVARLAISLLDALDYSHQMGTVHRDIKPSNVLLDQRSRPYIMDFGIAKSSAHVLKTMTGSIMGTPAYISPEQIQDKAVDGRADLYALATAMYEMLAGQIPFAAKDPLQILVRRMSEDPEPLSTHCPSISGTLAGIVMQGLAREPVDRYPDAGAMRQALVEYLRDSSGQQELVLLASAPEPMALEKLPSTVPDGAALLATEGAATVKMSRRVSDDEAPEPPAKKSRGLAWAVALAMIGVLTIAALVVPRMLRQETPPVSGSPTTAQPVATEDQPPVADRTLQPDSGKAAANAEPPTPSDLPAESLPATTANAETEAPGSEASVVERESPPPAEPRAERSASPPPPAPTAAPLRRPVTAPRIVSSAEPVLQPDQTAQCAGQSVIISLKVGENGQVVRSRVLKGEPAPCAEAARLAAEAYRFEPALDADGQPVTASTTLNIRFSEGEE